MKIPGISPASASTVQPTADAKALDAARQFEALLLAQILRAAHNGGGDDSVNELADQQLAAAIAQRGGLGLSDLIAKALESQSRSAAIPTKD